MTTTETPEVKRRTITLTNRAPVTINEANWPLIASAHDFTGEYECQANEQYSLRVRQHADGRAIVYGVRDRGPGGMAAGYEGARGGVLAPKGADLAAEIRSVGEDLGIPEGCIARCIADLPAEELDGDAQHLVIVPKLVFDKALGLAWDALNDALENEGYDFDSAPVGDRERLDAVEAKYGEDSFIMWRVTTVRGLLDAKEAT